MGGGARVLRDPGAAIWRAKCSLEPGEVWLLGGCATISCVCVCVCIVCSDQRCMSSPPPRKARTVVINLQLRLHTCLLKGVPTVACIACIACSACYSLFDPYYALRHASTRAEILVNTQPIAGTREKEHATSFCVWRARAQTVQIVRYRVRGAPRSCT